jgi:glycogen debranching enzyme
MSIKKVKQKLLQNIEKLRSPAGWLKAGFPRYNTLFGRDSLISAWQMLSIDSSITRATLQTLAKYQGKKVNLKAEEETGKILHEFKFTSSGRPREKKPNWGFPYYGSVDSTPLFIVLAGEYFRRTRDDEFLLKIWQNILAAFNWIKSYGDLDQDGYIEYARKNPQGLFHQGWKDGIKNHLMIEPPVAIVEAQGYLYAAYQSLVFLGKELGKNEVVKEPLARSRVLKKAFNKDFWMEDENCFALALDGDKKQRKAITSNSGHLLFTGIIAKEKIKPSLLRLFKPDLCTQYGVRTHSSKEKDFDPFSYHMGSVWPHDNWLIYKGLRELGLDIYAERIKEVLLRTYREFGKIPELYAVLDGRLVDLAGIEGVWANPIQAWSSAGLLEMIWRD